MTQPKFTNCQSAIGADRLASRLKSELLAGKHVLWLVTGGSNIPLSVKILHSLQDIDLKNLTIMLTDERYGPVGHADSNWQQLEQAGFKPSGAKVITVLQDGLSLEQTTERYAQNAKQAFDSADIVIAQIGMGPDGHILGILPDSPALKNKGQMAVGYTTETYQRTTLSPMAVKKIDAAYVLTYGQSRRAQLEQLRDSNLEVSEQPAQLLKLLPEAYIFNDQIGDTE